ncbi:uncharacterized protein B0I36DRAFT_426019 [Microdochium trichocladiopsis]|uniref:Uncharacterized protein n=1 Tax=Microdochium trichocladiopsis TaxID=1682393 RepID=A0A9P9BFX4_9PEZI|nr:uncharacterized protein B0I36DRAFT_426153 [Microdochium trichocladiopsis]XP_046005036.1 uncharacterized protein B0I36DRAFT_426019 [Microdochium trichocladiopsis]KAH7009473.1 hypothetical protein B0I36DRAFT_426153 [Microdochium trichocladiopsis]KAH7012771.1 hypothetical protein B0I36DRAFT_426019 [Microdochium trichocladiopsis]
MAVRPALVSNNIIEQGMFSACLVFSLFAVNFFSSVFSLILQVLLLVTRLPLIFITIAAYGILLQWFPSGSVVKKLALFILMGISGTWWTDLQIDGVRRGSVAQQPSWRLPQGGSVIVSSATSPIDAVYLAAAFDPIFTTSCPGTRKVRRLGLLQAILRGFRRIGDNPLGDAALGELETLLVEHPARVIVPSRRSPSTNAFRVSIRYTPPDVTTPDHGGCLAILWNVLSSPLHLIRVHIADDVNVHTALSQSHKTNSEPANLVARHNGDGPNRSSRSRVTRRRTTKRPLRVLGVIKE